MRSLPFPDWQLPASRRLGLIAAAIVGITIAAAGALCWDQHNTAIANAQQDLTNLGIVLAEQANRTFQAVDLVLRESGEQIRARQIQTPEQFSAALSGKGIHEFLVDQQKHLPQAAALGLFDATGNLVNLSRAWPVPALNVGDHFVVMNVQNFYGAPVVSGVYDGPISLPITTVSPPAAIGGHAMPATSSQFQTYVVLKQ